VRLSPLYFSFPVWRWHSIVSSGTFLVAFQFSVYSYQQASRLIT
jgi:hypothetical protein